jgi:hypothetical protein
MAQAPAPTTTDTTTAATTPPPVAEETAPMSPWAIGGVALLGVGAIAAVANDDDDDNNEPVEEPPPAPPPAVPPPVEVPPPTPPANTAPTSSDPAPVVAEADGRTALAAANFPFVDAQDAALTSVKIGAITATPVALAPGGPLQIDAATGHGYELVSNSLTWNEAQAFAATKGGYLAVLDTPAEMLFINTNYDGLGGPTGEDGTWVGASQAAGSVGVADGWTWNVGVPVATVPGTPIPAESELWNDAFGGLPLDNGDGENGSAQFGAIYDGTSQTDTKLLYDQGTATDSLPKFLIEYDAAASPLKLGNVAVTEGQVIAADQLANLTWNSVFTEAGSVKFSVGDSAGAFSTPENTLTFAAAPAPAVTFDAAQSVSTLIDDQHLSVLA